MTRIAEQAANHAIALRDVVPFGVDVHFALISTKQVVAVRWHRSPYRGFVATVKYGGLDMERRPLFWGVARYDLLAKEFVDHAKHIRSSVLVGARVECISINVLTRAAQILARRRVVRTSAAHRLR